MKSLKSKVILSAVVLIFALVATIGSTFAWFTVSSEVSASNLTLNVTTDASLLIKAANYTTTIDAVAAGEDLNPSTYTTSLSMSDFSVGLGYSLSNDTLKPATIISTSYGSASATSLNTIAAAATRALTVSTDYNAASGVAVQLKMWVMAQQIDELRLKSFTVTGNSPAGSDANPAIQNSLRGIVTSRGNTTGLVYGNDMDYDFTFAGKPLAATGTITDTNFNELIEHSTGSAAIAAATLLHGVQGTTGTGTLIQSLDANTPIAVFVTLYIEGWDTDANLYIIGAPFTVSFEFTIA